MKNWNLRWAIQARCGPQFAMTDLYSQDKKNTLMITGQNLKIYENF